LQRRFAEAEQLYQQLDEAICGIVHPSVLQIPYSTRFSGPASPSRDTCVASTGWRIAL
jgi:hypothetical protein